MSFSFVPAERFKERAGLFVSLTGGTNSGKTFSALRLARGIAGPTGKVAVLDTEGGRTLHLKGDFAFDANVMDPPFRPIRFAEAAKAAEDAGYDALVIDSFSMEWAGLGGVLDWQAEEHAKTGNKDSTKGTSWIKPKMAHKAMVYALLQRRIPIIFSIRGEETFVPPNTKLFKAITNKQFPFEVTVSFRLESDRKGYVDLSDPKSWKMEGAHQEIFKHGERISEEHGAALARWACGDHAKVVRPEPPVTRRGKDALFADARTKAEEGSFALNAWRFELPERARAALDEITQELDQIADAADAREAGDYGLTDDRSEAA
ncbi:AAA family ATPase [Methylobacterium goesingense]|uniref:AAA+ ATPase domain-containing protein n=1 Tax=Methylobacterium goesingense TaxID=243690 RepID=A0ABV2L4J7_9HYPH|nr:AAA family ATPase [Methylobacterium goesingense]GJD72599.1 hypothetical protein CFIICLFH_0816 [Methylobacterium goesingense]